MFVIAGEQMSKGCRFVFAISKTRTEFDLCEGHCYTEEYWGTLAKVSACAANAVSQSSQRLRLA